VGADGTNDPRSFTNTFFEDKEHIVGNYITPYGKVLNRVIFLKKSNWSCVFEHGSHILEFHIPRMKALTLDLCKESFIAADEFFSSHFILKNPLGLLANHTWLFTPQLQEFLEPESNLVRFQREFYLLPYKGEKSSAWEFIFDHKLSISNAPRDTALREKVLHYLESGKSLFDLGGIYLHSFKEWGSQKYMTSYDENEKALE